MAAASASELTVPIASNSSSNNSSRTPSDDEDAEEITETKIIGVTETGVIRKRSFKRKLTKEERSKRGYGNDKSEYSKIAERVMAERIFSGTVEGLQERLKMMNFMYTDCMEMVKQWEARRAERIQERKNKDLDILIAAGIATAVCILLYWLIRACIW